MWGKWYAISKTLFIYIEFTLLFLPGFHLKLLLLFLVEVLVSPAGGVNYGICMGFCAPVWNWKHFYCNKSTSFRWDINARLLWSVKIPSCVLKRVAKFACWQTRLPKHWLLSTNSRCVVGFLVHWKDLISHSFDGLGNESDVYLSGSLCAKSKGLILLNICILFLFCFFNDPCKRELCLWKYFETFYICCLVMHLFSVVNQLHFSAVIDI